MLYQKSGPGAGTRKPELLQSDRAVEEVSPNDACLSIGTVGHESRANGGWTNGCGRVRLEIVLKAASETEELQLGD